ncbi:MAG: HAMP domain-containing sensor histidine kinase [Bacteroidetes bacterium]|nr:HAMP domain-containing sensor histidine kinase [Bacteroidota bacterium]
MIHNLPYFRFMISSWLNWRTFMVFVAVLIVSGTIVYSQYLAGKIATEERKNVAAWVEAQRTILFSSDTVSINLASKIITENDQIPIIETNENDQITGNFLNLDTNLVKSDPTYLSQKLKQFKSFNRYPIISILSEKPYSANKYYYGESKLLKETKLYPIIQLLVVALFILVAIAMLQVNYKSGQNQLWASLAKETAHQLGTPVSSLEGWLEILKSNAGNEKIVPEIAKDVKRLQLITDRFGKIGSQPKLENANIADQIQHILNYMKKRAGGSVHFECDTQELEQIQVMISAPLFDWVMENLIRNALDAIDGKGLISIHAQLANREIFIDVTDSGKGIAAAHIKKVFRPGFTTKKRGWGLGLSLSKRIVEQYHKGKLFVRWSEQGKGTSFRIILPLT